MLTVETEENRDYWLHMKGGLPWLVRWAPHASTIEFCPVLAKIVSPVQNIISSPNPFFKFLVPIAQCPMSINLGRKSCWVACPCVSGYNQRQATWHDSLPGLKSDGDKWSEIVHDERTGQKSLLVPARRAQWTKQGPTPFVCTGTPWIPIRLNFQSTFLRTYIPSWWYFRPSLVEWGCIPSPFQSIYAPQL